jgi:hypothetical protein
MNVFVRSSSGGTRPNEEGERVIFDDLTDDLVRQVLSFLNVESLNTMRLSNKKYKAILEGHNDVWANHCNRLWSQKQYVTRASRNAIEHPGSGTNPLSAFDAYRLSCVDARVRPAILMHELVFDPGEPSSRNVWYFVVTPAAGPLWAEHDPWRRGENARKLVFLPGGILRELRGNAVESRVSSDMLVPPFTEFVANEGHEARWMFVQQPVGLRPRNDGWYIRLNIGSREFPTFLVRRSPTGNWGFVLYNRWCMFTSFPPPPRQTVIENASAEPTNQLLALFNFPPAPAPEPEPPIGDAARPAAHEDEARPAAAQEGEARAEAQGGEADGDQEMAEG